MDHSTRPGRHHTGFAGLFLLVAGFVLVLLPVVSGAAGVLPYSTQVDARSDGVGTTSTDLSGATFNELRNRVLVVDNLTDDVYEYDLDGSGSLIVGPRRTIEVNVGGGDFEGIAWISGDDYALLSENTGVIELVTIPDDVSVTTIDASTGSIDTTIRETIDGFGAEGIAVDRSASNGVTVFWVAREKDPALFQVDSLGNLRAFIPLTVSDAGGVYASALDDSVFVVSDESQQIVQLDVDTGAGTAAVVSSMDLPDFDQAEAITFSADESSLYLFGEAPDGGRTHARYQGPIVPTPTPTSTATPTATATPVPTATATPEATAAPTVAPTSPPVAPITIPADPGPFSTAPESATGAFGFGIQADRAAAASGSVPPGPNTTGSTGNGAGNGVGGPRLAATGRISDPTATATVGVVLLIVGAAVLVTARRTRNG